MGKSASVTLGNGSLNHNNRVFIYKNIDPSLTPQNVILIQKDLRTTYDEIFGKALEQYNQKQKRNDRKIEDYLSHVKNSKNGEKPFYEIIVQVGDRYNTGIGSPDAEIAKGILTEFYHEFVSRNPNMVVFNAVIHMDEKDGTPHMHIDFIPIARGQTRGLETKNSLNQALKQQGFDFVPTPDPPRDPDIHPYYGKPVSRFAGSRWLDAERAELGNLLERHGITWEKQDVHRKHLSIPEYKACAEIVGKMVREMPPVELETRLPNSAMRIAGVKQNEVIVSQQKLEVLQEENKVLRAESKIVRDTMRHMDKEKAEGEAFIRRTLKSAEVKEQRAKSQYSAGTEAEYRKLAKKYNAVVDNHNELVRAYNAIKATNQEMAKKQAKQLSEAVTAATTPLTAENKRLIAELGLWKKKASSLQDKVRILCQAIQDIMRSIFTLKYNYANQQANPYKSDLTEKANLLIDALERKARTTMHQTECQDFVKGLDGMGISAELDADIRSHLPKPRNRAHELGG